MQKIYSLLRSNKQSGPYSLEELLQLNLQPFDLVWVEGKSAGWSYPTEIESLKWHVTKAPKPIEEKEIATSAEPSSSPAEPSERTISDNLHSKHIYISLPAGKQIISEKAVIKEIADNPEESPEAKLERKAQELRNKIQAFAEKKNSPKEDNELDTKYSRSLDDIKEEYSSWLYNQRKKRKHFPVKYIVPIVIGSFVFIAAYFFFSFSFEKEARATTGISRQSVENILEKNDNSLPEEKNMLPNKKPLKATNASTKIQKKLPQIKPQRIYTSEEIDKVDAYLDSLKKVSEKPNSDEEITQQQTTVRNNGTRQSTKRNSEPATHASQVETDTAPFTELLKLSESTSSSTPHLNLYNNSNKYIKFVAVDVQYYNANQKLLKKKTFYFNDISPKSSARLYLPQEKKAASIKYQMGLISTDNGLYYASQ